VNDLARLPVQPAQRPARFDVEQIRKLIPALDQRVNGQPLVYLDTAATALKPQPVIDALNWVYTRDCANVHRGVHQLSQRATDSYEAAREKVRRFVNAREAKECVFVRGTTEAINLVAQCLSQKQLRAGDEVLISELEHHSNIVPWQLVCERTGAHLVVARISDSGELDLDEFAAKLSPRTRIVALAHVSNTLGTILPLKELTKLAHERGAVVVVDAAQAAPHLPIDVQDLDVDFYAFSGHKLYGPTGIGVLYGRRELFEKLPPYQGGGSMIRVVSFEKTTYQGLPERFEAGTPHIAGAIGLGAAIDFLAQFEHASLAEHEDDLLAYGTELLQSLPGVRLIGTAPSKIGVLSFVVDGIHPHDLGTIVDTEGVAIRTGHHCTQPLMQRFQVPAMARASLGLYNRRQDLDVLARAIGKAQEMFR
jgi:cysteine desulfurase / selenocysteine lyase